MTTKTYDGQTARFLASVATCMPPLHADVMQGWIDNPLILKNALSGLNQSIAGARNLLDPVTTVEVAGIVSFIVKEKFRERKTTDGVKVAWVGSNFENNFLGKIEKDITPTTLRIQKLKKDSSDALIIAELGDTHETTFAHFWELLKKQGSGQEGPFLVGGYMNIAYIRDKNKVLWAVNAKWDSYAVGWSVEALSVVGPIRWYAGVQIVSR